jgi:hypothetical protein
VQNSSVSFTSNIHLIKYAELCEKTSKLGSKHTSDFPWTVKQTVKKGKVFQMDIEDCAGTGVTDNTLAVSSHISPTRPENLLFRDVEKGINKKLKGMKNLAQGFLVGGNACIKGSLEQFSNFESYFQNVLHIPYTCLK